jgi:hypothetical protein
MTITSNTYMIDNNDYLLSLKLVPKQIDQWSTEWQLRATFNVTTRLLTISQLLLKVIATTVLTPIEKTKLSQRKKTQWLPLLKL